MREVGVYEARTHLARLVEQVAHGETVTITKHGQPMAMLVTAPGRPRKSVREAIEAMRAFRAGKRLGRLTVKQLVEEGRRR
ncbi:MAG: type II toxin-antitoxin system prevent-host-death family antitoxin [Actinomycetota bacterium]